MHSSQSIFPNIYLFVHLLRTNIKAYWSCAGDLLPYHSNSRSLFSQLNEKKGRRKFWKRKRFLFVVELVLFSPLPNDGNKFTYRQKEAENHTKSNMYEINNSYSYVKLEMVESIDLHHNYHSSLYCMLDGFPFIEVDILSKCYTTHIIPFKAIHLPLEW